MKYWREENPVRQREGRKEKGWKRERKVKEGSKEGRKEERKGEQGHIHDDTSRGIGVSDFIS